MSLEVDRSDRQNSFSEEALAGTLPVEETTLQATASKRSSLLVNRNFAWLWLGQTISVVGDYIFDATLLLWIVTNIGLHQSWAPLAVSGLLIMVSLPIFVVGPIAGVFVDRWSKRATMMRMDLMRAGLILALLLTALGGWMPAIWQLGLIYTVVLLASVCAQFFNPARLVLIGDIVPESERTRATGLLQVTVSLATFFGPVLAAILYSVVGISVALALNALSFFVSFLAIRAIKSTEQGEQEREAPQAFWAEFREGWAFCIHNKVLRTTTIALVVSLLGIGSVNALIVFFVEQNLHQPASYYSVLALALGIGTAVGAILASLGAQRLGLTRTLWLTLLGMAVTFFIFARLTNFLLALVVIFFLGLLIAAFNVALMPLVLKIVPRELVGRIAAMVNLLQSLTLMCSVFVAGVLDSTVLAHFHLSFLGIAFGPVDTIFTGVAGLVLIAGLYMLVNLAKGVPEVQASDPSSLQQ